MLRYYGQDECGRDGYPVPWHSSIKHEIRRLMGDRCARCRHPYLVGENGRGEWSVCSADCLHDGPLRVRSGDLVEEFDEWTHARARQILWGIERGSAILEAKWRILTVHHLDGDKRNCRWWNLAPLCQRCHLHIQTTVQMNQVFPFEHSEWFKPYAAGYYAFTYLGEDLSRRETELRLDELLALERMA